MTKRHHDHEADLTVGRDSDKFMLRFPEGMRDRIASKARANGRSMNAEIVQRLALSLDKDDIEQEPPMEQRPLPPGAVVDHGVEVWAERLLRPGNRHELEGLLATIRAMLGSMHRPE